MKKPNINKKVVLAWLNDAKCFNCEGVLKHIPEHSDNKPQNKFKHKCDSCSDEFILDDKFPKLEFSFNYKIKNNG